MMFKVFVPTFFILDFFIICFFISPIFFFKKTMFDRIYLPIIILLLTIFYVLNTCYFTAVGTVFSIKEFILSIQNIVQVAVHTAMIPWNIIGINVALLVVFAGAIILFNCLWSFRYSKKELKKGRKNKIIFATSLLVGSILLRNFSFEMWRVSENNKKRYDINYVNYNPLYHYKNLGMTTYYIQELRQTIFDKGESVKNIKEYLNNCSFLEDPFTGFFKKQGAALPPNIFVVMIETGDQVMLNQYTTPNLWKLLVEKGIWANRNYSINRTNISSILGGANGNYPITYMQSDENYSLPFNLPNILKTQDNYTTIFSTDVATSNDFYGYMKMGENFGFEKSYFHNDFFTTEPWNYVWNDFPKDSLFLDKMYEVIENLPTNRPFYLHHLTIAMHQDQILNEKTKPIYDDLESHYGHKLDVATPEQWKNPFDSDSEDYKRFRRWTLKTMDLDEEIGKFWDLFYGENSSEYLKNTMMVVYGDHFFEEISENGRPFGQVLKNLYDQNFIKVYSSVLGFYHPKLAEEFINYYGKNTIDKATWPTIIIPTILDVLGETFNPRLYQGKSIFDPSFTENEVYYSFVHSCYMNESYTSTDGYHITSAYDDDAQKREEFLRNVLSMQYQNRIITSIYLKDLFSHYDYEEFMPLLG